MLLLLEWNEDHSHLFEREKKVQKKKINRTFYMEQKNKMITIDELIAVQEKYIYISISNKQASNA